MDGLASMVQDGSVQHNASHLRRPTVLVLVAVILCAASGCHRLSKPATRSYTTVPKKPQEQAESAKSLNAQGLSSMSEGEPDEAVRLFKEALAADVNYGPAHNNLGQLYLARKQLYLAAWEFEFASKLMPDRSEPYLNLGLVFEMAGRDENAQSQYEMALELQPDNVDVLTALARLLVKQDADPAQIHWLLNEIVMRDSRPEWRRWAQDLLGTRYFGEFLDPVSRSEQSIRQSASGGPEAIPFVPEMDLPIGSLPLPAPSGTPVPLDAPLQSSPSDTPPPNTGVMPSLPLDLSFAPPVRIQPASMTPVQSSGFEFPSDIPVVDRNALQTMPASFSSQPLVEN